MQLVAKGGGGLPAVKGREGEEGVTPRVPLYPKRKCTIYVALLSLRFPPFNECVVLLERVNEGKNKLQGTEKG